MNGQNSLLVTSLVTTGQCLPPYIIASVYERWSLQMSSIKPSVHLNMFCQRVED